VLDGAPQRAPPMNAKLQSAAHQRSESKLASEAAAGARGAPSHRTHLRAVGHVVGMQMRAALATDTRTPN